MKPEFFRIVLVIAVLCAAPFSVFAAEGGMEAYLQNLTPGVPSAPVKVMIMGIRDALSSGVNHAVKFVVVAELKGGTAPVRVAEVYVLVNGVKMGANMANAIALKKDDPVKMVFDGHGLSAKDLKDADGIQLSFVNSGEAYQHVGVHILAAGASVDRDTGASCVAIGDIIVTAKEEKPKTVDEVRNDGRPASRTTGDGGGSSSSSCSPTSSNPNSPGTMANDSSVGTKAWSNMDSAKISDNAYAATDSILGVVTSNYLKATNFGFDLPPGATVDGITVEVEKATTGADSVSDSAVRIVKGGTIGSTEMKEAGNWPTTDAYTTYGSSSSKWGETWTANEINGIAFGFALSAVATGYPGIVPRVDHIRITVNYTPATCASIYDAFTDLIRSFSGRIYCLVTLSCQR